MTFLGTTTRHKWFWSVFAALYIISGFSLFADMKLSLDCIFSGLLALTGFVFTARTFITFKLNEDIYSSTTYREYVETLKADGAYKKELYAPLRHIDNSLGTATYMCIWATAMFLVVAFLPRTVEIKLDATHTVKSIVDLLRDTASLKLAWHSPKALVPFVWKAVIDLSMTYFIFCIYQMIVTTRAINNNIHDIIDHWETDYKKPKAL